MLSNVFGTIRAKSFYSSVLYGAHLYNITVVNIKDGKELEFAIFCIENIASFLGKDAQEVYKMLTEDSSILSSYIIPKYEMLHTQSKEYIVNDIIEFMRESGVIE